MAKDLYHDNFRKALQKDGWTITHDPYPLRVGRIGYEVDFGAEKLIAAEKGNEKIAIFRNDFVMEKIKKYQNIIIDYLKEQSKIIPANLPDIESHVIFDRENNHFQLLQTGWQGYKYIFTVVMHFDIKNGKVWFQRNITEHDAVDVLMERGVAKEDIVLGFRPPYSRAYTGFAVA